MKIFITLFTLVLAITTFGRGVEGVETSNLNVNFRSHNVSTATFKVKGVKLIKKLIKEFKGDSELHAGIDYKRVGASSITIKVKYYLLGKVLAKQTYELSKLSRKLFVRTVYYDGFANYKLQLDGVTQTFEHNPDATYINNGNSINNSNVNRNNNVNKNRNINRNRSVSRNNNVNVNHNTNFNHNHLF